MNNDLVSIIMPVHNEERFLRYAVSSVLSQTYDNWELLIIDDNSTDNSPNIIREYLGKDSRIKTYKNTDSTKKMPAKPRNIGISHAKGRYIAFLDADDQWLPTKLEHQLQLFSRVEDAAIVYADYKRMNMKGEISHRMVKAPLSTCYRQLLKSNVMGCLTVMYDTEKVGKQYCPMCGYDDYALWLQILRDGVKEFNPGSVEAIYRDKGASVSSNKFTDMRWQWHIYTQIEKLGILRSAYYFVHYAWHAVAKRIWLLTSAKTSLE